MFANYPTAARISGMHLTRLALAGALAGVVLAASPAQAQDDYPSKPVRMVVPFAPGGATDATGRLLANKMSDILGVQVFVENMPGASNQIGAEFVLREPADGYTIILATISTALLGLTNAEFKTDLTEVLTPITGVMEGPTVVAINAELPVKDAKAFLAYAKDHPGELNFGSQGASDVLGNEALKAMAGIDTVTVRYGGGGPVMQAFLSNQIQYGFFFPGVIAPHIESGAAVPVAVTSRERLPQLPDLPTVAESGVPGFEFVSWSGLLARTGTPEPMVAKLHAAAAEALNDPEVRGKLEGLGFQVKGSSPAEFGAYFAEEIAKWTAVAKESGFEPK